MRIISPSAQLLFTTPNPLHVIELAGRTCYKSEDKIAPDSCVAFCKRLIASQHESVLEHASMTVRFICSRDVSHELVRHRLASPSQESQRYVNYGRRGLTFILPPFEDGKMLDVWEASMRNAIVNYENMIAAGAKPEDARLVLPNSTKTELVVSANMREWRHILRMRASRKASPGMRQLMGMLLPQVRAEVPVLFDDVGEV